MQKWLVAALMGVVVMATAALAVPARKAWAEGEIPCSLTARVVGNAIALNATSPYCSRIMTDEWSGPTANRTRHVGRTYVARATFVPTVSGRYGVIYRIWQGAVGADGSYPWTGYAWAWLDVTVAPDGTITIN